MKGCICRGWDEHFWSFWNHLFLFLLWIRSWWLLHCYPTKCVRLSCCPLSCRLRSVLCLCQNWRSVVFSWHEMTKLGFLQARSWTFPVHIPSFITHDPVQLCPWVMCPLPFLRRAHFKGIRCNRLFTWVNNLLFGKHIMSVTLLGTQISPELKLPNVFPGKFTIPTTLSWGWPWCGREWLTGTLASLKLAMAWSAKPMPFSW